MSQQGEQAPQPDRRHADPEDRPVASWPACAAIAIVLVALFLTLPHL